MTAPGEPVPETPGTPAPPAPLVVMGFHRGWLVPTIAGALGGALLAQGSLVAIRQLNLPWMLPSSLVAPPLVGPTVVLFAAAAAAALARPFFLARAGEAELGPERIVYTGRGLIRPWVAWRDLEAYTDASPLSVGLLRRGETTPRPRLAIPTRTEEARLRVLHLLDEHGLRRVEVPARGRRLAWALLAGAVASGAFLLAIHAVNARYWRLRAMAATASSTEEYRECLARSVHVQTTLRSAVGSGDRISIENALDWDEPPCLLEAGYLGVDLEARIRLDVDGAFVASTGYGGITCQLGDWAGGLASPSRALPLRARHDLSPGRHEVRVVTDVSLGGTTCRKETRATLEVAPGSLAASAVALVRGATPGLSIRAPVVIGGTVANQGVDINYDPLEHGLAMTVEIRDGDTLLDRGTLVAHRGDTWVYLPVLTEEGFAMLWKALPTGHHVIRFRFTPSPSVAFENDPTITEIYGEPLEREVVIDVP